MSAVCKTCKRPTVFAGIVKCRQCQADERLTAAMLEAAEAIRAKTEADSAIEKARKG